MLLVVARSLSVACCLSLAGSPRSIAMAWTRCVRFFQQCVHEPVIPDRELCLLTPFQQWRKYKHFPLVIVLHILVVLFITIQVGVAPIVCTDRPLLTH